MQRRTFRRERTAMAEAPIRDLVAASAMTDDDALVIEQSGEAKKLLGRVLAQFIDRNVVDIQVTMGAATADVVYTYTPSTGVLQVAIPRGAGIADVEKTDSTGLLDTYTMTMDKLFGEAAAQQFPFYVKNGDYITDIVPINAPHAAGQMDIYEIQFAERNAIRMQVYNGQDGQGAPGSQEPLMDAGTTGTVGSAAAYSREDHRHPSDTSRQPVVKKFNSTDTPALSIAASSWVSNSTYSDAGFGYRAAVPLSGVTEDMFAEVVFAPAQALSGNYCPVCQTYAGGVYVFSAVNTAITIPAILVTP